MTIQDWNNCKIERCSYLGLGSESITIISILSLFSICIYFVLTLNGIGTWMSGLIGGVISTYISINQYKWTQDAIGVDVLVDIFSYNNNPWILGRYAGNLDVVTYWIAKSSWWEILTKIFKP